jgi:hypothetical protein
MLRSTTTLSAWEDREACERLKAERDGDAYKKMLRFEHPELVDERQAFESYKAAGDTLKFYVQMI